jgi:hypothetical protein
VFTIIVSYIYIVNGIFLETPIAHFIGTRCLPEIKLCQAKDKNTSCSISWTDSPFASKGGMNLRVKGLKIFHWFKKGNVSEGSDIM